MYSIYLYVGKTLLDMYVEVVDIAINLALQPIIKKQVFASLFIHETFSLYDTNVLQCYKGLFLLMGIIPFLWQ